jgi:hypothetical protein
MERLACGHIATKKTQVFQCLNRYYHDDDPAQRITALTGSGSNRIESAIDAEQNSSTGGGSADTKTADSSKSCQDPQLLEIFVEIFDAICEDCEAADSVLPKDKRSFTQVPKIVFSDGEGLLRTFLR